MSKTNNNKTTCPDNTEIKFTYKEFLSEYCIHLEKSEKSKQEIKNCRVTVRAWCEALKIDLNCAPAEEFTVDFNSSINKFIQAQINKKLKKKTYKPRVSIVRKLRRFFIQNQSLHNLPEKFSERLKYVLAARDYNPKDFWEHYLSDSVNYATFKYWLNSSFNPARRKYFVIDIIEEKLLLEPGILSSLLSKSCREVPTAQTAFGKKLKRFTSLKYCIWTENLAEELNGWIDFKTAIIPPPGMKRDDCTTWSYNETDAEYPTAKRIKRAFASFMGFCHLPSNSLDPQMKGLDIKERSLSLALLLKEGFVEKYITEFRFRRNDGTYNSGDIFFLIQVTTLLRPEVGYLYQKPEFAEKLGLSIDIAEWQLKCLSVRNRLLDIKNSIERERKRKGPGFKLGRNPEEPISEILESKHPLFSVMVLAEDMLQDVKHLDTRPLLQAVLYRDALLI